MTNFQKYVGPNRLLRSKKIEVNFNIVSSNLNAALYPSGSVTSTVEGSGKQITVYSLPGTEGVYPAGTHVLTAQDQFQNNIVIYPQIVTAEGILTDDISASNYAYTGYHPTGFLKIQIPTPSKQILSAPFPTPIYVEGSQTIPSIAFQLIFAEYTFPKIDLYAGVYTDADEAYFAMGIQAIQSVSLGGKQCLFIPAHSEEILYNMGQVFSDPLITMSASGGLLQTSMQNGGPKAITLELSNSTMLFGLKIFRSDTPIVINRQFIETDYLLPVMNIDSTRWFEKGQYAIAVKMGNHWELVWSPANG